MSDTELSTLQTRLLAIPAAEVQAPDLPMAVALQEANDLLTLVRDESVWQKLEAVGATPDQRALFADAIAAARSAQSQWIVVRDRTKSSAQKERETKGQTLRSELITAGRWNLRADKVALSTLSAIAEGEGVADLIQDLSALAELFERKRDAFANDQSFDVGARIEEARSLVSEISAGVSSERLDTNQASAVDLRNRAYSLLDQLVDSLRDAGRYAFRQDPNMLKRFSSAYHRQRVQRARSAAAERRAEADAAPVEA